MIETVFIGIVVFLCVLAVFDLVVGVSNDAVNFINSAIGAKAASFKVIITIAAAGVFIGAAVSNGMMDVARHGIFTPEYYTFYEVMCIFLAVMVTDVVLLDVFNTLGMPTSTTVSMVFEILGGACITGYGDWDGTGTKTNKPGVTFLVSPEVDLTKATEAYVTINHAMRYENGDINTNNSLLITDNYTGDVKTTAWKQIKYPTTGLNGAQFDFVTSKANIPAEFIGKKVVVALRHT